MPDPVTDGPWPIVCWANQTAPERWQPTVRFDHGVAGV